MQLKKRRKKRKLDRSQQKNGAYQQGKKYIDHLTSLDDLPKDIEMPFGFFSFPQDVKGTVDHGKRKFLVFYFDAVKDYKTVLQYLADYTKTFSNHPQMDTTKLVNLVKEAIKNDSKK